MSSWCTANDKVITNTWLEDQPRCHGFGKARQETSKSDSLLNQLQYRNGVLYAKTHWSKITKIKETQSNT